MIISSEDFQLSVLDAIEVIESRLLVWGITDGCLSKEEFIDLVDPLLDSAMEGGFANYLNANEVARALLAQGLIFETKSSTYSGYRSRMGETVRLLFYLRQMFPNRHSGRDGWQQARTLVSDFRFLRRRRQYPRRTIAGQEALRRLTETFNTDIEKKVLGELLQNRGEGFELSDFQYQATHRILSNLKRSAYSGVLVSAGTGSGKTLAFYIPALARIAGHVIAEKSQKSWVKCLALYPRNELLKDQFSEIYKEVRHLDHLTQSSGRKIRIGALFGPTPYNAQDLCGKDYGKWERGNHSGYICSYMACPTQDCQGDLVWRDEDLQAELEQLICSECGAKISEDEVTLTRRKLQSNPPDILFTTTEMLNQRLSDSKFNHLFGLRSRATRPLEMVLLDEIHTYSGIHGAQVAYLLRRLKRLVASPITFVGLSATLRDGKRFFERLTDMFEGKADEIYPKQKDLVSEGAEYLLALKGDPVSKTSLLSTTIQTAMLLSRMLDPQNTSRSNGIYGKRIFAFTDDIDVTNRLFFGLLDAEGCKSSGHPDAQRHPNGGLAHLREPIASESRERNGQNWSAPRSLGHDLKNRHRIGRTSSQDPGVVTGLDVVVATSSLEVGFNDPNVGAVIQHKAPRNVASFLQRKGRAGRSRKMRPWTVLVLSDYGRDRLAYQAYDHLFDPELDIQAVPLGSRHIQGIQAVYTLFDYLGVRLTKEFDRGSVWQDFSGPSNSKTGGVRQKKLQEYLEEILREPNACAKFSEYLKRALRIEDYEVDAILWEHPRPLMTTVIPTAIRRLDTNWRRGEEEKSDFHLKNSPLPEFAPSTLFSELSLPEVSITLPSDWDDGKQREPVNMPIVQAMRTFAPGRVSHRFGTSHAKIRHWVAPEGLDDQVNQSIDIEAFYICDHLGEWQQSKDGEVVGIPVFRPIDIRPSKPGQKIKDTSNAQLNWHTQIVRHSEPTHFQKPKKTMWTSLIEGIDSYTHGENHPVEMRRFAMSSNADIQVENTDGFRTCLNYTHEKNPAALGFAMNVDALCFQINIPEDLWRETETDPPQKWKVLRTARFFDLINQSATLPTVPNPFIRQWLGTIYFSTLTYEALNQEATLSEAHEALRTGEASTKMTDILEILFQASVTIDEEDDQDSAIGSDQLRKELSVLLMDEGVLNCLHETASILWVATDESWEEWLQQRYKATVAAAAFDAMNNLCPDLDSNGLVVDIEPGPPAPDNVESVTAANGEFWISETSPGGIGLVEEFIARYGEDPRRFYALLTASLQPNEHETIDFQLLRLLDELAGPDSDDELIENIEAYRNATGVGEAESAFHVLREALTDKDYVFFHGFATALNNRIIRPGSSRFSDAFLFQALTMWTKAEERLGVELEPRTIAHRYSQSLEVDAIAREGNIHLPSENLENWRFNVVYGLLWPRGNVVRKHRANLYNPFYPIPDPERLLVITHLVNDAEKVTLGEENWHANAIEALANSGLVTLVCPVLEKKLLSEALNFFITNPIQTDYLSVFARMDSLRRVDRFLEADLQLAEAAQ
jgi:superfamily II DNA or RNA helicase